MKESLSLGPTPAEESCEQLGPNYDATKARAECRRFIELLEKKFPNRPSGARFKITSNAHDFGTYYEVEIEYEEESEAAIEYAFMVERDAPSTWEVAT